MEDGNKPLKLSVPNAFLLIAYFLKKKPNHGTSDLKIIKDSIAVIQSQIMRI